ncbi:SET domain-containing protein [Canariomyces notabilis]|uniref:SET domain-containing protein n=1 Tax=Canariomyces notabilis TaxID=2074819 RepID=A0AAN6YT87_9PEZI|nr:SET domain-containing protein [Canariomyces arenarius]
MPSLTALFLSLAQLTVSLTQPSTSESSPSSSSSPQSQVCGRGTSPPHLLRHPVCLDALISSSSSPPASWTPWTHPPHCIPASDEPWCVYTNAAALGSDSGPGPGIGISIITTPDIASSDPLLHPAQHRFHAPFFAPDKLYTDPRPYKVRDVPGKGKGAVAIRRIEKGRAVLVDYASVLAAVEYPADVLREEVQELLSIAAERLGEPGKVTGLARKGEGRASAGLEDGGGEDAEGDMDSEASVMEDVMLTNSFGVVIGGREFMGLFSDLARFNHDCKPNAFIHFSETTLAMTVWAARDIEPGEEITITYSAAGMTSKERQQTLEKVWGFKCQCSLCTSSPEALNASDTRRAQIPSLREEVVKLAQKGEFNKAITAAETLFSLVEEEGLTEQMGDMYEVPARLYYHVGNLEKALEYTLKVKHEIDGYGFPGKLGMEKLKMLKGVIARIERELKDKKKRGGDGSQGEEKPGDQEESKHTK